MKRVRPRPSLMFTVLLSILLLIALGRMPLAASGPENRRQDASGSISGRVWHDIYHTESHKVDGIQDPGEPDLIGVVLELYNDDDTLVATTTTNSDGEYTFSGLAAGTYRVKIADSNFDAGGPLDNTRTDHHWYATMQDQGGDDSRDSDGDESSFDVEVTLAAGEHKEFVDFGFFQSCVELEKTGPYTAHEGDSISYHFRVENCGDVVLHGGVGVYDPLLEPDGDHQIWWHVVYPQEVYEFDRSYTVQAEDCPVWTNTATAEGHPLHPRDDSGLPAVTTSSTWTVSCYDYDWGDAPDSYDTSRDENGPRHIINSDLYIGATVDAEDDGQPTSDASGDDTSNTDDEDGVSGCIALTKGAPGQVSVPVNNDLSTEATLYGWIDFNGDGDFEDSGEATSVTVPAGTHGSVTLSFGTVPLTAPSRSFARLRLTTDTLCSGGGTYRDTFSTVAYNNSDGTLDWSPSPWDELRDDDDPASGRVKIVDGKLLMARLRNGEGIQRAANLSGASQAILSFDWETGDLEEEIALYVSADGTSFHRLATYGTEYKSGHATFDITPYATANTVIRFVNDGGNWSAWDDEFRVDNVQIEISSGCIGGPARDGEVEDHEVCFAEPNYTLGDRVWRDTDGDGIQDDGEPGIQNVRVDLYSGTCASLSPSSTPLRSDTTDGNGLYSFTNLPAGDYCVVLNKDNYNPGGPLVGLIASPAHQGGDPTKDSDASPALKADVHLDADNDTIDFGLHPVPPIEEGTCYVMADYGDFLGLIDHTTGQVQVIGKVVPSDGENLAIRPSGFTIYNVAGENTATPLQTIDDQTAATTIINPDIGLDDVDALAFDPRTGTLYAVAVDPNPGVLYIVDPNTGNTTHVVNLQFPSPNPLAGKVDPHIDGLAIDPVTGVMYGAYSAWASKSYLVTIDPTTGALTLVGGPPGDPGYTGVDDIEDLSFHPANGTLYGVLGSEGAIGNNPSGSFEGLVIIDKTTAAATPVGPYGTPLQGTEDGRWDIEAFACSVPASITIGDYVWNDTNGNGLQDGGEPGLDNITVRLYRDDGDHVFEPGGDDALVATQTTSGGGAYDFTVTRAGTYWVDVDDGDPDLSGYTLIPGPQSGPDPKEVTVNYGDDYNDADFGYAGRGNIAGTVFYDWDEDGQQDAGEEGIGGVQVCLYRDDGNGSHDAGDALQACVNTASDGTYTFNGYLPGRYFVVETQPSGLESTTPNIHTVDLVVVGASGSDTDNDFGEIVKGRIGDFVWVDSDGDGIQDPGETNGITHLPLHVTGVNVIDETVDLTVTTSVTGYYMVEDLLPGTYTVTAPGSYGGLVRTSSSPLTTTLTVGHMEDRTLDFGYIAPTGFQITRFVARAEGTRVRLEWAVRIRATEPTFYVWRSEGQTPEVRLSDTPVTGSDVQGNEVIYRFVDDGVRPGRRYSYWLQTRDGAFFGPWSVRVEGRTHGFLPFVRR